MLFDSLFNACISNYILSLIRVCMCSRIQEYTDELVRASASVSETRQFTSVGAFVSKLTIVHTCNQLLLYQIFAATFLIFVRRNLLLPPPRPPLSLTYSLTHKRMNVYTVYTACRNYILSNLTCGLEMYIHGCVVINVVIVIKEG